MSIRVFWENEEKSVLVCVFEGVWTKHEFSLAVQQAYVLMDSVYHRVNTIIDLRKSGALPPAFIGTIHNLSSKPHSNQGTIALVGMSLPVQMFYDMFLRIHPILTKKGSLYTTANYDEAHAIFARDLPSLAQTPIR